MTKWIIYAEERSMLRMVTEYMPMPNPYGIRIRAVKDAIRLTSGARWAVDGYYLISPGKKTIMFSTLQEAKRAGEAMTGGAR